MCGTTVGQQLTFGVASDEASLVTQSVSATRKSDKKEARDKCGDIISVTYYNKHAEVSIEGLGSSAAVIGAALTMSNTLGLGAGTTVIEEVTLDLANEEYVKSSIKAMHYSGINV